MIDLTVNKIDGDNGKEKQLPEFSDGIKKAMQLADLQERVMNLDVKSVTYEDIDKFFEGFEDNVIAQKIKEKWIIMKKLVGDLDDEEIVERLLNFKPKGAFILTVSPVAFDITFYDPRDWINDIGFKKTLLASGVSASKTVELDGHHIDISVNMYNPVKFPREKVRIHEFRHAMNVILDFTSPKYLDEIEIVEDRGLLITKITEQIIDYQKAYLMDELSAFIASGSSQFVVRFLAFRHRYAVGLYDFKGMPDNYWNFCRDKYNFSDNEISIIKKRVAQNIDIAGNTAKAYRAVRLLEKKGYSRSWAVSYLCSNGRFADWQKMADDCPSQR